MKKKIIALAIAVLTIGSLCGCNNKINNKEIDNNVQKEENISPELDKTKQEDNAGDTEKEENKLETKKVGKENYGFVEVPSDWVDFKDVNLPDDTSVIQYSNHDGSSIITLNIFENAKQSEEEAAQGIAQKLKSEGVDVKGAVVNLKGYKAYQVYGKYEDDGTILVIWYFKDENNTLHYISAEGKELDIVNTVEYVEKTYSVK